MPKILILAGEPSGDNLASQLIREIKHQYPFLKAESQYLNNSIREPRSEEIVFQGIGGPLMKNEGHISLFPMDDLAVMGLFEVLPRLPKILRIIKRITGYVEYWKPDLIITVDSPDFSFRLVKAIRDVDKFVPIIHYVAPSVWAWREQRAKKMAKIYDKVLALLPFEPPYFEKYGLGCEFVGHPIATTILPSKEEMEEFLSYMDLDYSNKIIAILPVSRRSEIFHMLPIFLELVQKLNSKFPEYQFVLPATHTVSESIETIIAKTPNSLRILSETKLSGKQLHTFKLALFSLSTLAISTSGSVSLELARCKTPMIASYRCSWLFEKILKTNVKLKTANLINIIDNTKTVPELLFDKCTPNSLFNAVCQLLQNPKAYQAQEEALERTIESLCASQKNPCDAAAAVALSFLD